MPDLRDMQKLEPKSAAKRLRTVLKAKNIDLSHGECLELVAKLMGFNDWNVLAAASAERSHFISSIIAPPGWVVVGKNIQCFSGGLEGQETHLGHPVFWLRNDTGEDGHATLMQSVAVTNYIGKRVRFSGHLRAENVGGSATIWLRADDSRGRYIAFNNLETLKTNGALKGSTSWMRREVVLDIPEGSQSLNFGFYLSGSGHARFAGLDLRVVGHDVPVTGPQEKDVPENLDFSVSL